MTHVDVSSNVIPIRVAPSATRGELKPGATVVHAVAGDEDLVELASVVAALARRPALRQILVHGGTNVELVHGAHLARIHHPLAEYAGSPAERIAAALVAVDAILREENPAFVVIAGDDDLALAVATAAAKRQIAIARLAAGKRSWDWTNDQEINRTVIDHLSDAMFAGSNAAVANLRDEGIPDGRIHFVGSTRIDTLRRLELHARAQAVWEAHGARAQAYILVVLERPETVEPSQQLAGIASALGELTGGAPVLLLQQPTTRSLLEGRAARTLLAEANVRTVGPLRYLEALSLKAGAGAIVTDADAVQEEACALGVACYTLAQTTASTVTLTHGTNTLLGSDPSSIAEVEPARRDPTPAAIPMWDGHAGDRVAGALLANYTLAPARLEIR
jgi:UDP-N-acetylglucosamine 2-epimerase (non-hydrolysing)